MRLPSSTLAVIVVVGSFLLVAQRARAEAVEASSRVTVYRADFFAKAQPYSAFDMLALLPGYTFYESGSEVRGYAEAAGNVLIDGNRPASKHDSLETILRRIPAASVSRIELIRPGAPGVDMQGHTLLANVVRAMRAQTRAALEVGSAFYERDFDAPRAAVEFSRRSPDTLVEVSAAQFRTVDDEHGDGGRPRFNGNGDLLRDTVYTQDEGERVSEMAAGYEHPLAGGKLRLNGALRRQDFRVDILGLRTLPNPNSQTVVQYKKQTASELGMHYGRALGGALQLEIVGLRRDGRERGGQRGSESSEGVPLESSLAHQDFDTSESILRGVIRHVAERWTFESGAEGALNVLDSRSRLQENELDVPLPYANVQVEERRGEAFMLATWRMATRWTLEAGSRFESSVLVQSGDSHVRKSFFFAKPRALLSFAPDAGEQWRMLVERRVGQLDFAHFVSSTSLATDQVTAGNPDLEPDRTWRAELAWERHFVGDGALVLAARHDEISELVDRVPVRDAIGLDGVGNIGDGERDELELNLSLPLRLIGVPSGLLRTSALWRESRATDPATGRERPITGDKPRVITVHFTQDLPLWNTHWGVDVELAASSREFRTNEIKTDRVGTMLSLFAEYEPSPAWNIRAFANNLTDRSAQRERLIYDGVRGSAPLDYIETRTLRIGPYVGISVRRSFAP